MRMDEKGNSGPLRVAVLGGSQVGKTALTVRYLTKRYIGEYRSDIDMLYRCVLQVDGTAQPVEIMDCQVSSHDRVNWAHAFIVVYAINDKDSYATAADTLQELSEMRPSSNVLILGNKSDLGHFREVEEMEARSLANFHSARFTELSTAESCEHVVDTLDMFMKEVKGQRCMATGNCGGNTSPKQRKLSVTRMLGSLIGRHSPPPQPVTEIILLDEEERTKLVRSSRQI